MPPQPPPPIPLSTDTIDDLIYFSRTNDLASLQQTITQLSTQHSCPASTILLSTIDIDPDGLGSGSCLLHYPSANGNVEIVGYLLSLLLPVSTSSEQQQQEQSKLLVNHQNISGNTPLHWAGMNGHIEVVKALVHAGADPEVVNEAGRDVVVESEWSSREGAGECVNWLLRECGGLEKGVAGMGSAEDGGGEGEGVDVDDGDDGTNGTNGIGEQSGNESRSTDKRNGDVNGDGNGAVNGT